MKTSFTERVFRAVARVPRGKVTTYLDVARVTGNPRAVRAVGNALNRNRNSRVPCHRVVRSDGSVGGFAWGTEKKIRMLRAEGVAIVRERVDLKKFRAHGEKLG